MAGANAHCLLDGEGKVKMMELLRLRKSDAEKVELAAEVELVLPQAVRLLKLIRDRSFSGLLFS